MRYPDWQVWRKPLTTPAGGHAILIINLSQQKQDVNVTYAELGLPALKAPGVTDAWTGERITAGVEELGLYMRGIDSHDSVFLVISPRA